MKRHAIFLTKNSFDEILYTLKWELKNPATKSQLLLFMEASYNLIMQDYQDQKKEESLLERMQVWAEEVIWFLLERCVEDENSTAAAIKLEYALEEWSQFSNNDAKDVLAEALGREFTNTVKKL